MRCSKVVRRALCLALLAAVLVMTAAPALASSKPTGAYVVTTSGHDRLRVHTSPWGEVFDYLKRGTVVVYKYRKSGWWKVEYHGGSGYVDRNYLTSVTSLPSAKYKSVDKIWVRAKPKSSSAKLGRLKTSMKVSIIEKKGSWVRIKRGSATGWVSAKYLRRVS